MPDIAMGQFKEPADKENYTTVLYYSILYYSMLYYSSSMTFYIHTEKLGVRVGLGRNREKVVEADNDVESVERTSKSNFLANKAPLSMATLTLPSTPLVMGSGCST